MQDWEANEASSTTNANVVVERLAKMHTTLDDHDRLIDDALRVGTQTEITGRLIIAQLQSDDQRITAIEEGVC